MAAFEKFDSFVEALAEKVHNLGSDDLKLVLTLVAPLATNTQLTNLTEIAAGNGYVAGGQSITVTASSQTSGTYSLVADDEVFTASGGAFADFRYVALYNNTATNDELIGFYDNQSTITLNDTETFTVDFAATVLTIV